MDSFARHGYAQGHRSSRVETKPVSSLSQQWEYGYAAPSDGRRRPAEGVGFEDGHREAMRARDVYHRRPLGTYDPVGPYREREAIHERGPYREGEPIHQRVELRRKHEEPPQSRLEPRADSASDTDESGPRIARHTRLRDEDPGVVNYYFDLDPEPVFYSFGELAGRENGSPQLSGDGLSDNESGAAAQDEEVSAADETLSPAAYHVLESQYSSDGYEHGHHSAKLTAVLSERATVS
ncbi:uncharacterized protein C8A04DRAFT_24188 [Dichotomopilus funicola]|uniref:Uncharacterized protein n=1 Tax=Dichotomopilus funicola TaxID=1934379 RepID=A0AAN6VB14_9PEZI|nr:hypothetical protein C8A04DRAFT_24188 [Dichotomopilus funicola]